MIISHQYKFIFLKTTKTAGTSIEIALSKFCGPDDIVTPISREDEKLRRKLGFEGPRNYQAPPWKYGIGDIVTWMREGKKPAYFKNHLSAASVRSRISRKIWNSYFKFCVERNPWDRAVSFYYWQNPTEPRMPFPEFMESRAPVILKKNGFGIYTINNRVVVDKICRYENLTEELEAIRLRLGIPEALELPHAKSNFRKDRGSYHDLYGEAERARIAELFSEEIGMFGYEY